MHLIGYFITEEDGKYSVKFDGLYKDSCERFNRLIALSLELKVIYEGTINNFDKIKTIIKEVKKANKQKKFDSNYLEFMLIQ